MLKRALLLALATLMIGYAPLRASERKDIVPGDANWHRYRFYVVGTDVAVHQRVTVLWENASAGMLLVIYDVENPNAPKLVAVSAGNDRMATLDVGLLKGSYQLVVAAVNAPTHYHLNVTYGRDELLFQEVGARQPLIDVFTERLISEDLAPYLAKLAKAFGVQ